jgi:hypothetical protein
MKLHSGTRERLNFKTVGGETIKKKEKVEKKQENYLIRRWLKKV